MEKYGEPLGAVFYSVLYALSALSAQLMANGQQLMAY
jgi:hypothetical protein